MPKKSFAIFGGSFDPPHICHVGAARLCVKELGVERLFIVPTFLSPFKSSFSASPKKRYEWLCKVFFREPFVEVLDIEIVKNKSVYTIETVRELSKKLGGKDAYDKIYLIIGSDNLAGFKNWREYEELTRLTTPVVVARDGAVSKEFKTIFLDCPASSSSFRESLDEAVIPEEIREEVMKYYKEYK